MRSNMVLEVPPGSLPLLEGVSKEAVSGRRSWSWATRASQPSFQNRNSVLRLQGAIEGFYSGSYRVQICILAKLLWQQKEDELLID